MTDEEYMARAAELAEEAVREQWGGPFGAVVVRDDRIIATGQNLVLRTGDPTAHAEIVAIRRAAAQLWPGTLEPPEGEPGAPARMLEGCTLYSSSFPCPMCLGAVAWARISALWFGCGVDDAAAVGFDDAQVYQDLARPLSQRSIPMRQVGRDRALLAMRAWSELPDRRLY